MLFCVCVCSSQFLIAFSSAANFFRAGHTKHFIFNTECCTASASVPIIYNYTTCFFCLQLTVSYHFFIYCSQFLITFFICCSQFLITFLSAANLFQSWSHQVHTLAWHGPHRHSTGLVGSEPRNPIFLCPPQPHGTHQHPGAQLHTSAFLHQQQLPAAGALHAEQNLHDGGRVGCLEETDCRPGHDAGDQATGLVSSACNLNPVRFRAPYVLVMAQLKSSLNIADYRKQIADLVMMGLVSSDSHQKPSEA